MKNEKKVYETPVVTKVEYDASDRITASSCYVPGVGDFEGCDFN